MFIYTQHIIFAELTVRDMALGEKNYLTFNFSTNQNDYQVKMYFYIPKLTTKTMSKTKKTINKWVVNKLKVFEKI